MHIAMYAPVLPSTSSANGIVTYVRIMQAALRANGHKVTVFDRSSIEHSDGRVETVGPDTRLPARLIGIGARWGRVVAPHWPVTFQHIIERVHAADPIDVLEMEESFGWAGRLKARMPVVARLHGPHVFVKDEHETAPAARISAARIRAERRSITSSDAVVSPSGRLLEQTLRYYSADVLHTAIIRNPMPLSARSWSADRADRSALLFVGRFDRCKGADLALQAFAVARRSMPDLTLTMCGPDRGIMDGSGVHQHFQDWTRANLSSEVRERITYIEMADARQLEDLRSRSSLMISTSRYDTFPYSVAEALACGLPILLPNAVGLSEILTPGESAFTFADGDVEGAASAIVQALADRAQLAAVGAAGRRACADHLSPTLIAEQTVAFYEQVLQRG